MGAEKSSSLDSIPSAQKPIVITSSHEDREVVPKTSRELAIKRCVNVLPAQIRDRDAFFDYLSDLPNQEEATKCYKVIAECSQDAFDEIFDTENRDMWKKMCSHEAIKRIVTKGEEKESQTSEREKKQTLIELRTKIKNHPYISEKNKQIIEKNDNPLSSEFQQAVKSILAELKAQAEKSGDFKEYRSFVEQFHSIGAVSGAEYAVFKREMAELAKKPDERNSGKKSEEFKLPEGFRESQNTKGVYTRFASLGEKFDEVVTLKDEKGSKDIISARSGYVVHLDNAVDFGEQEAIAEESRLRTALDTPRDLLKRTDEFIANQEKQEKEGADPEKARQARENKEKAKEYREREIQPEIERIQNELEATQKKLQKEQSVKKWTEGEALSREEKAHDTIAFVDDMGLYALWTENVNVFFDLVNNASSDGKIDISDGLDSEEKMKIKKAFIHLLGEWWSDLFDDSFRLRDSKTVTDIQKLLPIYHPGETPPVRTDELKLVMTKGTKTETQNTLE